MLNFLEDLSNALSSNLGESKASPNPAIVSRELHLTIISWRVT